MADNLDLTMKFSGEKPELSVEDILDNVYAALKEKGYNPVNQIVGYLISGDPAYITNHNSARAQISKVEREDIVEVLVMKYLDK